MSQVPKLGIYCRVDVETLRKASTFIAQRFRRSTCRKSVQFELLRKSSPDKACLIKAIVEGHMLLDESARCTNVRDDRHQRR